MTLEVKGLSDTGGERVKTLPYCMYVVQKAIVLDQFQFPLQC